MKIKEKHRKVSQPYIAPADLSTRKNCQKWEKLPFSNSHYSIDFFPSYQCVSMFHVSKVNLYSLMLRLLTNTKTPKLCKKSEKNVIYINYTYMLKVTSYRRRQIFYLVKIKI